MLDWIVDWFSKFDSLVDKVVAVLEEWAKEPEHEPYDWSDFPVHTHWVRKQPKKKASFKESLKKLTKPPVYKDDAKNKKYKLGKYAPRPLTLEETQAIKNRKFQAFLINQRKEIEQRKAEQAAFEKLPASEQKRIKQLEKHRLANEKRNEAEGSRASWESSGTRKGSVERAWSNRNSYLNQPRDSRGRWC
jgi:hypothetical protein